MLAQSHNAGCRHVDRNNVSGQVQSSSVGIGQTDTMLSDTAVLNRKFAGPQLLTTAESAGRLLPRWSTPLRIPVSMI